jgi:hypothetical protein
LRLLSTSTSTSTFCSTCSLLVSFRVFTTQHASAQLPHIFGLLRAALLTQLDAALAAARQVGGACVPLLPAQQREAYIRQVSSTEGLAALAATVVRNASSVLKVCIAGPGGCSGCSGCSGGVLVRVRWLWGRLGWSCAGVWALLCSACGC